LAEVLDERPADDPERTFVIFMCAYAGDVLAGVLRRSVQRRGRGRYARACLVPAELLERAELDVERAARALQLPACEMRVACVERAPSAAAQPARRWCVPRSPRACTSSSRPRSRALATSSGGWSAGARPASPARAAAPRRGREGPLSSSWPKSPAVGHGEQGRGGRWFTI
jgi:hypothetical protein